MLDIILTLCLLLGMPGYVSLRDHRAGRSGKAGAPGRRLARYRLTILIALGLLALCAAAWISAGRPPGGLGLDWPLSIRGWIGLAIAATVLLALAMGARTGKLRPGQRDAEAAAAMMPQTASERRLAVVAFVVIGVAWEVLYRGYLLWRLTPRLGLIGAIVVAALAYGLAHGVKTARQLGASLAAAFVFTIAYALTKSLWWLMIIHAGLPLLAMQAGRPSAGDPSSTTLSPEASHPA